MAALISDVPDTYPVQAAMSTGINTMLIADEYGLDRALTAAVIAWTTAIVVVVGLVVALL
jgi:predicted permease